MTKKCGSLHPPNVVLSATALVQPKTSSRLAPNLALDRGMPIFWKQSLAKYCRIGLVHQLSPEVLAPSYLIIFFSRCSHHYEPLHMAQIHQGNLGSKVRTFNQDGVNIQKPQNASSLGTTKFGIQDSPNP